MAHDYEDLHNVDSLDDTELRDLVREQLASHPGLDVDDLTVQVRDGKVTLAGRVGTEGERRIASHVLTDVLGIVEFTDDVVVDPIARGESPADIDEHLADEAIRAGALLGDVASPQSDEAAHLAPEEEGGEEGDLSGTSDYGKAMEEGMTWNPPSSPTPEGLRGSDGEPSDVGENH